MSTLEIVKIVFENCDFPRTFAMPRVFRLGIGRAIDPDFGWTDATARGVPERPSRTGPCLHAALSNSDVVMQKYDQLQDQIITRVDTLIASL